MHRFFVDGISDTARITGEDFAHLSRVLRLKAGDAVTLSDGQGTEYDACIERLEKDAALCRVTKAYSAQTESPCRVTLFQCLPKAGKLETVIQKCTELGVYAVQPLISRRCVAAPGDYNKKLSRYQRVAYEAAKQSRRGVVPRVEAPKSLDALDALTIAACGLFLVAYEGERERTLKSVLQKALPLQSVGILIGPEGGFEESEIALLSQRGAIAVSLGKRILRTETAGPAMLAQILYEAEP